MEGVLLSIVISFFSALLSLVLWLLKGKMSDTQKAVEENKQYAVKNTDSLLNLNTNISNYKADMAKQMSTLETEVRFNSKMLKVNELQMAKIIEMIKEREKKVDKSLESYGKIMQVIERHRSKSTGKK